ncbi:MAG: hypothetical protein MZV70_56430 [Desulfobacterales bacterium]|nr:hypothetical protein [Desulfobacterales bacterium]
MVPGGERHSRPRPALCDRPRILRRADAAGIRFFHRAREVPRHSAADPRHPAQLRDPQPGGARLHLRRIGLQPGLHRISDVRRARSPASPTPTASA